MRLLLTCLGCLVLGSGVLLPSAAKAQCDGSFRITPERLGLPADNERTAGPDEPRAYHSKADGKTPDRGKGGLVWYPSKDKPTYKLNDKEVASFHGCVDISSRPEGKKTPEPLPFKAGVFGKITAAREGFIEVTLGSGIKIQYLHVSKAEVKEGQEVRPNDILGKTGSVGASQVHLHIQAKDKNNHLLDPDRAFCTGTLGFTPIKPVDPGPMRIDDRKPKVVDGVVQSDEASRKLFYDESAPKSKKDIVEAAVKKNDWRYVDTDSLFVHVYRFKADKSVESFSAVQGSGAPDLDSIFKKAMREGPDKFASYSWSMLEDARVELVINYKDGTKHKWYFKLEGDKLIGNFENDTKTRTFTPVK